MLHLQHRLLLNRPLVLSACGPPLPHAESRDVRMRDGADIAIDILRPPQVERSDKVPEIVRGTRYSLASRCTLSPGSARRQGAKANFPFSKGTPVRPAMRSMLCHKARYRSSLTRSPPSSDRRCSIPAGLEELGFRRAVPNRWCESPSCQDAFTLEGTMALHMRNTVKLGRVPPSP